MILNDQIGLGQFTTSENSVLDPSLNLVSLFPGDVWEAPIPLYHSLEFWTLQIATGPTHLYLDQFPHLCYLPNSYNHLLFHLLFLTC